MTYRRFESFKRVRAQRDELLELLADERRALAELRAEIAAMRGKLDELRALAVRKQFMCEAVEAERAGDLPTMQ